MSQSFAHGRGSSKTTCLYCKRTVRVVALVDGSRVETDTELISVVVSGEKQRRHAHRIHSELCGTYQREAERAKLVEEKKAYAARKQSGSQVVPVARPMPLADTRTSDQIRKDLLRHYRAAETARTREIARSMR